MKAIVLAGGNDQIALLKLLRERDIYTILIDFNKEPIAKPFAGVLFSGKTTSELNEKIAQFDNSIKILNDSQADIFIHGLPLLGEES